MNMRKAILVVSVGFLLSSFVVAQERYSQVRIPLRSKDDLVSLGRLGLALDDVGGRPGRWLDLFLSAGELDKLARAGISYSVLIPDWHEFYAERLTADRRYLSSLAKQSTDAVHFHLGSMGGSLTLAEVAAELDSMHALYPTLITAKDSIGASVEGLPIWAVKISRNAAADEAEPRALYTGIHHAREAPGMMTVVYTMWYLLENYGTNPEVTDLLDHRELYFIPVVNPDGYAYNELTNPDGGGMWRKNRRMNADASIGVDLNRNYGFQWGHDNVGSSGIGSDETYRGASAFSEPETRVVRDFCIAKGFSVALNYHTFGQLLVYPWGYSDTDTGDSLVYRRLGDDLTAVNRYTYGTGGQTVGYVTNGDSDDWMYGETGAKPRIFSMTPEVGNEVDYFWAVPSRILPIARENLPANLYLAHAAGEYITTTNIVVHDTSYADPVRFDVSFVNKGMKESSLTVDLTVHSDDLDFVDSTFQAVLWQTSSPLAVQAYRKKGSYAGEPVRVVFTTTCQGGTAVDTLQFYLGPASVLYADDAESTRSHWISVSNRPARWDTTRAQAHSGTHSFADSPTGYYLDNTVTTFTLDSSFALYGSAAELRFWTKWDIETNYDYARVEISSDAGTSWIPLKGRYTQNGSGVSQQVPVGSPGYAGIRHAWVQDVIDLGQYLWFPPKMIRFRFESDGYVTRDGIYIDDINLLLYPPSPDAVTDHGVPGRYALMQNYPNPFNPKTEIRWEMDNGGWVVLKVYDVLGREVTTLVNEERQSGKHAVQFDGSRFSSGVYFYRMSAGKYSEVRKMVLQK
jgi:hypothetical protein